jgi:hypothetical protein
MPRIMPSDIVNEVETVLRNANKGKGESTCWLTAYQILHRLPHELRDQIISERLIGGAGTGVHYAAPSIVSDAAEMVPNVHIDYLDCENLTVSIDGIQRTPGYPVCGLYRVDA